MKITKKNTSFIAVSTYYPPVIACLHLSTSLTMPNAGNYHIYANKLNAIYHPFLFHNALKIHNEHVNSIRLSILKTHLIYFAEANIITQCSKKRERYALNLHKMMQK